MTSQCSVSHLVETDSRYEGLKQKLIGLEQGSDEYIKRLIFECPLSLHPDFKAYLERQGVAIEGTKREGYSAVYRSSLSPNSLITCLDEKLQTLYDHFMFSVRMWPKNECLGKRPYDPATKTWAERYEFQNYEQVAKRIHNIGSGFLSLVNVKRGKRLGSNDFIVAILSHNMEQWVLSDLACQAYGLTNTALYESLGPETSEYIMNLTESPLLIFAKQNMYKVIELLPKLKYMNTLVCMEELDEKELKLLNDSILPIKVNSLGEKISLFSLQQVEDAGRLNEIPISPPKSDDVYTISFTSGTTGIPKGVVTTQRQLTAGVAFVFATSKIPKHKRAAQLRYMCFLPLAHILQRMLTVYSLSRGIGIGFLHKPDPLVMVEDMRLLKADFATLVPRILTRFEAGIKSSLEKSSLQNSVATNFLDAKQHRLLENGGPDKSLLNTYVFHRVLIEKIRDSLGMNNCDFIIMGSAPISPETLIFLRSALDMGMRQGYGMTEAFGGIAVSESYEKDPGTCGPISSSVECRLRSVPEMGYDANDLKGEIQVRGAQVFQAYFKRPDETAKVIDSEGWFSTGDIGSIDSVGRISIIDRVKNFFKLSQGEYIAPEKVESLYSASSPQLTQIFVHGDSLQSYLVGIVGIDVQKTRRHLASNFPEVGHMNDKRFVEAMNKSKDLRKCFLSMINKNTPHLQGFEKLHNIYVDIDPFKVEDDTMTPTLKIKRLNATKHFKSEFSELYEEGSLIKVDKL